MIVLIQCQMHRQGNRLTLVVGLGQAHVGVHRWRARYRRQAGGFPLHRSHRQADPQQEKEAGGRARR